MKAEEKLEKIRVEWNSYVEFLKSKYPTDDVWEFTCDHHKKIDDILNNEE